MNNTAQNSPRPESTPERPVLSPAQRQQKKRIIRLVILICLGLLPLFAWLEKNLISSDITLPINSNILLFGIINLNVLLVLLIFFLVLRNLAELLFESRQKFLGFKLKTKLVTSFICLSLIPAALLFFVALQFISTSMDYWFNTNIEQSLQESLELAKSILHDQKEEVRAKSQVIAELLSRQGLAPDDPAAIRKSLENIVNSHSVDGIDSLSLISDDQHIDVTASLPTLTDVLLPAIPISTLHEARDKKEKIILLQESSQGDLIRCVSLLPITHPPSRQTTDRKSVV